MAVLEALRDVQRSGLLPPALAEEMASPQVGEQGPPEPAGWGFGLGFAVLRDAAASGTPKAPGAGAVPTATAGSSTRRVG